MKILLIRHAESQANVSPSKLIIENDNGIANPVISLTEKGLKQAKENGLFLKKYLQDTHLKIKVWNSPYQRTRQTMQISTNEFLSEVSHYRPEESPLLGEIQFGLLETVRNYSKEYSNEYNYYHHFKKQNAHFFSKSPMGESPAEMSARLKLWLNNLSWYGENDLHIVYAHGAAIRALLLTAYCLPYEIYYLNNPVNASIMEINVPTNLPDHEIMLSEVNNRVKELQFNGFSYIFKPSYYIPQ